MRDNYPEPQFALSGLIYEIFIFPIDTWTVCVLCQVQQKPSYHS